MVGTGESPGLGGWVSWHCPADRSAAEGIFVSTRLHRSTGRLQCLRRTPQFLLSGVHPTLRVYGVTYASKCLFCNAFLGV